MTDGEVASAQSSGLVKPAPPLPPSLSPPLASGALRAVAGARAGREGAPCARARVCVRDYRPTG